jgi:hypothetical protein
MQLYHFTRYEEQKRHLIRQMKLIYAIIHLQLLSVSWKLPVVKGFSGGNAEFSLYLRCQNLLCS